MQEYNVEKVIKPVAYFKSPFSSKFGIPRQSGVVDEVRGRIVLALDFRREEALRGIEGFSHLWLVWGFSGNDGKWNLTVRPPRLGGNKSVGVFASRSPFRPNGLGLSSVRLISIDMNGSNSPSLIVAGADLMDGTPIYDIKPYIRYTDSHPDADSGFTDTSIWQEAEVIIPNEMRETFLKRRKGGTEDAQDLMALSRILAQRPVPQYKHDPKRTYGMPFMGCDIKFHVTENSVIVTSIDSSTDKTQKKS